MLNITNIKKLLTKRCVVKGQSLEDGHMCFTIDGYIAFKMPREPQIVAKLMEIGAVDTEGNWTDTSEALPGFFTPGDEHIPHELSGILHKDEKGLVYHFITCEGLTKLVRQDFVQCCEDGTFTAGKGLGPVYHLDDADGEVDAVLLPIKVEDDRISKAIEEIGRSYK